MHAEFENAMARVGDVVMFEGWLRFYFMRAEKNGKFMLRLPEGTKKLLRARYPHLAGLAESLDGLEADYRTSIREVCRFAMQDGPEFRGLPEDLLGMVLDSQRFHLNLQMFTHWVAHNEEALGEAFREFSDWKESYAAWKNSAEAMEHLRVLTAASQRAVQAASLREQ